MKVKFITTAILLALLSVNTLTAQVLTGQEASGKVNGAKQVILNPSNSKPSFVEFEADKGPYVSEFGTWLKQNFGYSSQFGLNQISSESDKLGFEHIRYSQTFMTYPINHSMLILHVKGSRVVSFNGDLSPVSIKLAKPGIDQKAALQSAVKHVGAQSYKWEIPAEEAFLKREQQNEKATFFPTGELMWVSESSKGGELVLAYRLDVYAHMPMSRQYVFVNANSGVVTGTENRIHHANETGSAVTAFSGTRSIVADNNAGTYRLREAGRGAGLGMQTYDARLAGTSYAASVDFTDADNIWNNVNANKDQYATDAHWGAEVTYDYFYNKFGRNSIDNAGLALLSYVHVNLIAFGYGNNINAFWDGTRMSYGDGGVSGTKTYLPLTALDIAGHEITHGLTEKTANLVYSYESGALNEAYSDIFGNAIEFNNKAGNWLVGEDIGSALRSMSNPNLYGQPDTYLGTSWYTGTGDNGGVHYNSGVLNYWFYLLSVGGSGTNDKGKAFSVSGIGIDKASAIAFRTLTVYLTSSSQYANARDLSIQAATDLYGSCSAEVTATRNAMYAVGLESAVGGTPVVTAGGPLSFCNGGSVVLSTAAGATSYQWNLNGSPISGATSTSYTANQSGNFSVTATTCAVPQTSVASTVAISTATASISPSGSVSNCSGSPVLLTATTSPGYNLQWKKDNVAIPGANSSTYSAATSGNYSVTISGTTNPASTFSTATAVAIPDNSCTGATSPITVSGLPTSYSSNGITIKINVTHTWDADVKILLESPTGELLALANANGGSGDNFTNTIFSDAATTNISAGVAPFTGTYKPIGTNFTVCAFTTTKTTFASLGNGTINPNGVWKLRIYDQAATDAGTINNWQIDFPSYSTPSPNCGPVTSSATAVTIGNAATPTISAGGQTTFCEGGSVVLTSSSETGNLWSNGQTTQSITVSTAGNYSVTATNGGCSATSALTSVQVNPLPTVTAANLTTCEGAAVTLTGSPAGGTFSLTNPYSGPGTSYTYTYANANGCSNSAVGTVTVNPLPTVFNISGGGTYCDIPGGGATVNLSGSEIGVNYEFKFTATGTFATVPGTGSSLSVNNVTGVGTVYVLATNATTGCFRNMNMSASVFPQAPSAWYQDSDGDGYGNAANSTQACSQPLGYVANATDCDDSNNQANPGVSEICGNGIDDNCNGSVDEGCVLYTFYRDADGDTYGNIAETAFSYNATTPAGYVTNSTDCNDANSAVNPGATEVCGNGMDDNCNGSTDEGCVLYTFYQDNDGDTYGNPAVTSTSNNPAVPSGYVTNSLDCNDANSAVNPAATEICNGIDDNCDGTIDNGTPALNAATAIAGPAGVCRSATGQVFSVSSIPGATSYIWTLPTGATGSSTTNSITVAFSSTYVTGNICVRAANSCVQSASFCRSVVYYSARPGTPVAIIGSTAGACGDTRTYSVANVANTTSYNWTAPANSTIVSGQGTNTVSVQFLAGFTSGNLSVTASNCLGASTARTLALSNATGTPASISGSLYGNCAGSTRTFSCPSVSGATVYTWTVPANAIINSGQGTNSINVTFPTPFTSGSITVKSGTACFTSAARSITVYSVPVAPASITGTLNGVCGGTTQTYSCPVSTSGGTTYTWTVPVGSVINSGQGTNSISLTLPSAYSSGTISVVAGNACGNSTLRSVTVRSLPTTPGTISGPTTNLCGGGTFTYSIAAVAGATGYTWTPAAGCSIVTNLGTSITLSVPSGFTTGTLSVIASNACGNSTATSLALTRLPATPGTITGPIAVCPLQTGLAYSVTATAGLTYTWTMPGTGSIQSGQGTNAISATWGTAAGSVIVRANNACGSSANKTQAVTLNACRTSLDEEAVPSLSLYPNPGTGKYSLVTESLTGKMNVSVYNMLGTLVTEFSVEDSSLMTELNITNQPSGVYMVKFQSDSFRKDLKVIKQ